jgi:Sec-independent protein translocase protein TatA
MELILILLLALIIFGPNEIQQAGKTIGKSINKIIRSESWRAIDRARHDLSDLPNRLIQESGLEELKSISVQELPGAQAVSEQSLPHSSIAINRSDAGSPASGASRK